jgi:hypothetical protein
VGFVVLIIFSFSVVLLSIKSYVGTCSLWQSHCSQDSPRSLQPPSIIYKTVLLGRRRLRIALLFVCPFHSTVVGLVIEVIEQSSQLHVVLNPCTHYTRSYIGEPSSRDSESGTTPRCNVSNCVNLPHPSKSKLYRSTFLGPFSSKLKRAAERWLAIVKGWRLTLRLW